MWNIMESLISIKRKVVVAFLVCEKENLYVGYDVLRKQVTSLKGHAQRKWGFWGQQAQSIQQGNKERTSPHCNVLRLVSFST